MFTHMDVWLFDRRPQPSKSDNLQLSQKATALRLPETREQHSSNLSIFSQSHVSPGDVRHSWEGNHARRSAWGNISEVASQQHWRKLDYILPSAMAFTSPTSAESRCAARKSRGWSMIRTPCRSARPSELSTTTHYCSHRRANTSLCSPLRTSEHD
jgi:hypothetical protein